MGEALTFTESGMITKTAEGALASGEVIQMSDGRAAYVTGLNALVLNDPVNYQYEGLVLLAKTASITMLAGGRCFWVRSTGKATPLKGGGDFFVGTVVKDAAAADTTVLVDLNKTAVYEVELRKGNWSAVAALGLGTTQLFGGGVKLEFDATAEIAKADLISDESVVLADGPIFEGRIAIFDIGDHVSLDINFGLANATHATDADLITESVFFHLDGASLNIMAESDDGTTEVTTVDTTVDAVDDTFAEFWIDARNLADIKLYIDGVRVLSGSTFKLDAATGPIKALVHIEKTSNDTLADVRVDDVTIRTTDLAA